MQSNLPSDRVTTHLVKKHPYVVWLSFLVHGNWSFFPSKSHSYSHRVLPPFQPKKNLNKNDDINLRKPTQLTAVPCLWIRSLNEPTKVLDLEIAHLNEDRSSWGANVHGKKIHGGSSRREGRSHFSGRLMCVFTTSPNKWWVVRGFKDSRPFEKQKFLGGFVCHKSQVSQVKHNHEKCVVQDIYARLLGEFDLVNVSIEFDHPFQARFMGRSWDKDGTGANYKFFVEWEPLIPIPKSCGRFTRFLIVIVFLLNSGLPVASTSQTCYGKVVGTQRIFITNMTLIKILI